MSRLPCQSFLAKPPTFGPWMSDRLRAVSWFGDEKNQILKVVAFTALEWLKGAKTGVDDDPPVKLFVQGINRWRNEDAWPLTRARDEQWFLHAGGSLQPSAPSSDDAKTSIFDEVLPLCPWCPLW